MLFRNTKNVHLGAGQVLLLFALLCNDAVNARPIVPETEGLARRIIPAEQACRKEDLEACNEARAEGEDRSVFKRITPAEQACMEGDGEACIEAGAGGEDTSNFKRMTARSYVLKIMRVLAF